jgi:hypothetical protein
MLIISFHKIVIKIFLYHLSFIIYQWISFQQLKNWENIGESQKVHNCFDILSIFLRLRKIQRLIGKNLMTFKFENIFFHLIHSKEFVAQFRVRVVVELWCYVTYLEGLRPPNGMLPSTQPPIWAKIRTNFWRF